MTRCAWIAVSLGVPGLQPWSSDYWSKTFTNYLLFLISLKSTCGFPRIGFFILSDVANMFHTLLCKGHTNYTAGSDSVHWDWVRERISSLTCPCWSRCWAVEGTCSHWLPLPLTEEPWDLKTFCSSCQISVLLSYSWCFSFPWPHWLEIVRNSLWRQVTGAAGCDLLFSDLAPLSLVPKHLSHINNLLNSEGWKCHFIAQVLSPLQLISVLLGVQLANC